MTDKARYAAFNATKRVIRGSFSNLISFGEQINGIDRAFAENIVMGTIERDITLGYVLDGFIEKKPDEDVIILLKTAVYQLLYMDRVPDNAVCDETVKIAKAAFGSKYVGFVNAVLRSICRSKAEVFDKIENAEEYIKYSVNKELFELIKAQYPNCYDDIFNAFFGKTPTYLRVNTLKANESDVAEKVGGRVLSKKTIECINPSKAIEQIDCGDYYVQGLASQKAVELLDAKRGMTVIDVCACPGGKTLGAAIDMENDGRVLSFDIHKNKLKLIDKSAERLGIGIITADVNDARFVREDLIGIADRVICDVPCSGTGVMGSKPEIKYKSPDDFCGLYPTQRAIIDSASKYLKAGGEMVYSTCSINKIENEEVIKEFLSKNENFSLIYEETCLPFKNEKEGFYMAKLRREF